MTCLGSASTKKSSFINAVAMVLLALCGCYSPPPPPPPTPPPPALPPARFCSVCSRELYPDLATAGWMAGKCFTVHPGGSCLCNATRDEQSRCPRCAPRTSDTFADGLCVFCGTKVDGAGLCANDPHMGATPLVILDTMASVARARAAEAETRRIMSRPTVAAQPAPACPTCGFALVGGRCSLGHLDRPSYGTPPPPNPNAPCPVCGTAMLGGRCFMAHTRQQPQPQPQPRVNAPCPMCRTPVANDGRCYVDHSTLCPYCGAIKTQQELMSGRCRSCGR